jgi:hypothetical protein
MNQLWIGALIGAGGTLLGAITGGVLNYLNTRQQLQYQRSKEYRDLRRAKLEEFVIKLEQTSLFFSGLSSYILSIRPPQKIDQEKLVGKTPYHAELMMLAIVYAPELLEPYGDVVNLTQSFADLINACRWRIDRGECLTETDQQIQEIFKKEDELTKAFIDLSWQVAELAKQHLAIQETSRHRLAQKVKHLHKKSG